MSITIQKFDRKLYKPYKTNLQPLPSTHRIHGLCPQIAHIAARSDIKVARHCAVVLSSHKPVSSGCNSTRYNRGVTLQSGTYCSMHAELAAVHNWFGLTMSTKPRYRLLRE